MKKEILITGIICLFVGVGIQPAFAVEISNVRPSDNIEDCGCQDADSYDIVRVKSLVNRAERLINRVKTLTKLIPILSKDNSEVMEVCLEYIEICQEKLVTISLSIQSGKYELICSLIEGFGYFIDDLIIWIEDIHEKYPTLGVILYILSLPLFILAIIMADCILVIGILLDCDWIYENKYERIQQLRT